jgi:radial spoke head protein 9
MADIKDLSAALKVLAHNGTIFDVEQRFQLENSLQELLNKSVAQDYDELVFWGRISGINADYYIAMGICYENRYEFPEKKFYWCSSTNGMVFEQFPALNK